MTLLENPEYNTLLQAVSIGNKLLTLLESQENKINELTAQVDAGLIVSDAEVTARIRAELQAQFDTAFNDALTLIGASTSQLSTIRDSILGVHTEPVEPVEPEPEEEPVIPSL
jgi:hypothetical protein